MKTIGAISAKTRISELLEQVAMGESFVITMRGKAVASLAPVSAPAKKSPIDIVGNFRSRFAKSLKPLTAKEMTELRLTGQR